MNIELLSEEKSLAEEKYREYRDAAKISRDPLYTDLRKVYYEIKKGKSVISIEKAIKAGGIRPESCHPRLAIAAAWEKICYCRYGREGTVMYSTTGDWPRRRDNVVIGQNFEFKNALPQHKEWDIRLQAPVPIIPPRLRPTKMTHEYFILWEVDAWTIMPSKDPYLLKRLTKDLFLICAAWDLTNVEMAVMAGRIK